MLKDSHALTLLNQQADSFLTPEILTLTMLLNLPFIYSLILSLKMMLAPQQFQFTLTIQEMPNLTFILKPY